ncbi:unnamed protein product [Pleuronectes platessa]|uniref:Uncharacterized protein n=1 Tax=Pleuronectes platessa TaxID=8262 RepID=A0A9N7V9Q8_PLEPL|nr:unnamed protein product [Pleuronectes platessa]
MAKDLHLCLDCGRKKDPQAELGFKRGTVFFFEATVPADKANTLQHPGIKETNGAHLLLRNNTKPKAGVALGCKRGEGKRSLSSRSHSTKNCPSGSCSNTMLDLDRVLQCSLCCLASESERVEDADEQNSGEEEKGLGEECGESLACKQHDSH